jgi:CelD/BcsL family acetyltransferase involved in cellulose biosynthesis
VLIEAPPGVSVEVLADFTSLEGIAGEWFALWAETPTSTPFQSPRWLLPWWRHFGTGELFTIALRHDHQLVAIIPLYLIAEESGSVPNVRLLGTGITDYLDALCRPGFEQPGSF